MQLATMTDRVFRAVTRSTMAERCRVKWGFVPRLFVVRLVSAPDGIANMQGRTVWATPMPEETEAARILGGLGYSALVWSTEHGNFVALRESEYVRLP